VLIEAYAFNGKYRSATFTRDKFTKVHVKCQLPWKRSDRQPDQLVYELYELTTEEIAIVEASSEKH
jgi:hypothetical protein